MITIHHNFDETKFKWLWAKYVRSGNIDKHCTACMIGTYSKKFSGTSNHDLLAQPTIAMDEVVEDTYEAIYFCGVLKKGYQNKNPLKNNYAHNVHLAVRPVQGANDVWDFENWHVEIEDGIVERIPETYELKDKFFHEPYTSHYYTCRIFRWMVGHFYPHELENVLHGYPNTLMDENGNSIECRNLISELINYGRNIVKDFMADDTCRNFFKDTETKYTKMKLGMVSRKEISEYIYENTEIGSGPIIIENNSAFIDYNMSNGVTEDDMLRYIKVGVEEELDMFLPYQERILITDWDKNS